MSNLIQGTKIIKIFPIRMHRINEKFWEILYRQKKSGWLNGKKNNFALLVFVISLQLVKTNLFECLIKK